MSTVGIIANPQSGKDIRRLVAHASVFDNQEKVNIVRRVLLGLDAVGVERVLVMPEYYGIGSRAAHNVKLALQVETLAMPVVNTLDDSTLAARLMRERGVRVLITLGGDGTNRAVAKESGALPILPISTGTNNVFPQFIEGTLAGMAAGLVARDLAADAVTSTTRLEILENDVLVDIALIDAVVFQGHTTGTRAIWDAAGIRQIVLTRAAPFNIGFSAIGGNLPALQLAPNQGLALECNSEGPERADGQVVLAPIAPGLVQRVAISNVRKLAAGDRVAVRHAPTVLALDGERTHIIRRSRAHVIRFSADGPRVLDVRAALAYAAARGVFVQDQL